MKRPFIIYRNILLPLLATMVVTACTLMDNDLRDLPDNPAFREIVHEEGEGYTADYQYQPWTILVDDSYEKYIYSMDYVNSVLYLYDYIPKELLPEEGNSIAAKPSDKLEWGLSYKVHKVLRDGSYYAVIMQRAELLDIFKYIEYNQEDSFKIQNKTLAEIDTTQNSYVLTRAGRRMEKIPYDKPNDPYWTEEVNDFGTWKIDLVKAIATIAAMKKSTGNKKKIFDFCAGVAAGIVDQTLDDDLGTIHEIHYTGVDDKSTQEVIKELLDNKATRDFREVQVIKDDIGENAGKISTERKKREIFYETKLMDAFSWEIDGWIQCLISLTPTIKTKSYIYENEKDKGGGKADVSHEICGDFGFSFLLSGALVANVDILAIIEHYTQRTRPQLAKLIAAPAGLPIWFHLKPMLNLLVSAGGRIGYNGHKYFSLGYGYRKNIPKQKDGYYHINHTKELEWNERKKWTAAGGVSGKIDFEAQIKLAGHVAFGIGIPGKDFLNAITKTETASQKLLPLLEELNKGINVTIEWDPSIAVDFQAEREAKWNGQSRLHFGIPVSANSLLFVFRPWPGFEIPVNFGDYLRDWLGGDLSHEFCAQDWYWYPMITLGSTCTNADSNDPPEFHIEFVVDDLGINYNDEEPSYPYVKIYKAGKEDEEPMYIGYFPGLEKNDTRKHFSFELKNSVLSNGTLKRGEIYNARLELRDKDDSVQCYQDNYFTSITPSAYVKEDNLLAWEGRYKSQTNYHVEYKSEPENMSPSGCTFIFNTKVIMENHTKIKQLGFYVGKENKRYVCEGSVASNTLDAIWEMNVPQPHYVLSIRPFVVWEEKKTGRNIENIWPTPYIVDYDYLDKEKCPRDPNWGGEGKAYRASNEKIGLVSPYVAYYSYGKDTRTDAQKKSVVAKEKSEESRMGLYIGDEDGVPTYVFTINPEDLE